MEVRVLVINLVFGTLGTITNAFTLFVVSRVKLNIKSTTNVLLNHLFIVDILASISWNLCTIFHYTLDGRLFGRWGDFICAVFMGDQIFWVFFYVSTLNLCALCLDRYLCVVWPIVFRLKLRTWHAYVYIIIIYAVLIIDYMSYSILYSKVWDGECWFSYRGDEMWALVQRLIRIIIYVLLPVILLIYCTSHLYYCIRKRKEQGLTTSDARFRMIEAQMDITKTIIVAVLAFLILVLPPDLYIMLARFEMNSDIMFILFLVSLMNLIVNPLIYIWGMKNIRSVARSIFCCGAKKPQENESQTDIETIS